MILSSSRNRIIVIVFLLCCFTATYFWQSCSAGEFSDEEDLKEVADSFATKYFNWRFPEAMAYTTESSAQWIRYAASNVSQEDVDALRMKNTNATVAIDNVSINYTDSTATVDITVKDALMMDTIGTTANLKATASYTLNAEKRGGQWKIKLDGMPRE